MVTLRAFILLLVVLTFTGCPRTQTPIDRAIAYLDTTQTKTDRTTRGRIDYEGNWPQVFYFQHVRGYRIPDVSPFVVAFNHHALTFVTPATQTDLGVSDDSVQAAAEMRHRAILCLKRFEARTDAPDAGTYGFWPYDNDPRPNESPLEQLLLDLLKGPLLGGARAPANLSYYPTELGIPADADVTATTYAAFLDDAAIDGGPASAIAFENFFADWRDTGDVPLRFTPDWLPGPSGAYLTWLMYREPGAPEFGNDLDVVVNANVLFALARAGKTDTPGFDDAVAFINDTVAQGLHRTRWSNISLYYPDSYVFNYCVTRAYREGPVPSLKFAARLLARQVRMEAIRLPGGLVAWNKGNPHLNTAFAVLTLLNYDDAPDLIEGGIRYLERTQNPRTGSWDEAPFFIARADGGAVIEWASAPLTTAFALEALCRYRLQVEESSRSEIRR